MIVLDIETSGLSFNKNGIVSIGAICLNKPEKSFYQECRIDDGDEITEEAMKINGFNELELRDKKKQSQKEMIENFLKWVEEQEIKILAGHNVGFFDLNFIKAKAEKYGIKFKTRYRSFDLPTTAQLRHFQINGKFLLDDLKENAMNLSEVLKFCGLPDERIKLEKGKVIKEGKRHNALEDCKLAAECFSRLIYGKNLLVEYAKFKVPECLRK